MDERDILPDSIRSGANFNVHPQYSWIEDRVASLKDFCTSSYYANITVRLRTHKIYTHNLAPHS